MKRRVLLRTRQSQYYLSINRESDDIGGEGYIFHYTLNGFGRCVLKIYVNEDKANKNREKILYLMNLDAPFVNDKIRYCWPIAAIFDEQGKKYLGFMMQEAFPNSQNLTILDSYYIGQTIADIYPDEYEWHNKFELQTEKGLKNRYAILYNWAIAIWGLHKTGKYVLGDIKPENVMVTPDGKVSIIDIDSIQVEDKGRLLFESNAHTLNYLPSEAYDIIKLHRKLNWNCDSFAMGCCFYSILTGTHPYANTILKYPYNNGRYNMISDRIKADLYLRGKNSQYLQIVENHNLHAHYHRLSKGLQTLFERTFCVTDYRPTAREWAVELKKAIHEQ